MAEEKKVRGQIHFRITPEEAAKIEAAAEAANLTPTMYAKKIVVNGKIKPQVISKELGQAMLPHISHMGSNLNQLAKKANEGGTVAAAELAEVKAEFDKLWDLVLYGKKPKPHKTKEEKLEERKPEPPHCKLCGAEMFAGNRKKDNAPVWYCPNFRNTDKGQHDFMDRSE